MMESIAAMTALALGTASTPLVSEGGDEKPTIAPHIARPRGHQARNH